MYLSFSNKLRIMALERFAPFQIVEIYVSGEREPGIEISLISYLKKIIAAQERVEGKFLEIEEPDFPEAQKDKPGIYVKLSFRDSEEKEKFWKILRG